MGRDPAEQAAPDSFSSDKVRDTSPSPTKPIAATETAADTSKQRHKRGAGGVYVLPSDRCVSSHSDLAARGQHGQAAGAVASASKIVSFTVQ
jgi:hypothetical protein